MPPVRALRSFLLVLFAFGVPFGLVLGLLSAFWVDSASDAVRSGLTAGMLFGLLSALVLTVVDQVGDREARRGERLGPRQDATVPVRGGPDLPHRVRLALLSLPAEIRAADVAAGRWTARTTTSWRSFGEEVTVQLRGDPDAPLAHVASRPVVRTTLLDYGKGRRNVHRVVDALQE